MYLRFPIMEGRSHLHTSCMAGSCLGSQKLLEARHGVLYLSSLQTEGRGGQVSVVRVPPWST